MRLLADRPCPRVFAGRRGPRQHAHCRWRLLRRAGPERSRPETARHSPGLALVCCRARRAGPAARISRAYAACTQSAGASATKKRGTARGGQGCESSVRPRGRPVAAAHLHRPGAALAGRLEEGLARKRLHALGHRHRRGAATPPRHLLPRHPRTHAVALCQPQVPGGA